MPERNSLTIIIKNDDPIELQDVIDMFLGLKSEYKNFLNSFPRNERPKVKQLGLYLSEVRKGSLEFDLVSLAPVAIAGVEHLNTLFDFGKHLNSLFNFLHGDIDDKSIEDRKLLPPVNSTKNAAKIIKPIAKDGASQLIITGGHNQIFFQVDANEADKIQHNVERLTTYPISTTAEVHERLTKELPSNFKAINEKILEKDYLRTKVLFYWSEEQNMRYLERGIIEEISPLSLKVIFESDELEKKIRNVERDPFDVAFIVDVYVQTIESMPWVYKIYKLHEIIEKPPLQIGTLG